MGGRHVSWTVVRDGDKGVYVVECDPNALDMCENTNE